MTTTRKSSNATYKRRIQATIIAAHGTTCSVIGCERVTIVGGTPTDGMTFNLGHVVSEANGGEFITSNLLPLCRRCNKDMGDRDFPRHMMRTLPLSLPLLPDPGTAEVNMEAGPLAG